MQILFSRAEFSHSLGRLLPVGSEVANVGLPLHCSHTKRDDRNLADSGRSDGSHRGWSSSLRTAKCCHWVSPDGIGRWAELTTEKSLAG